MKQFIKCLNCGRKFKRNFKDLVILNCGCGYFLWYRGEFTKYAKVFPKVVKKEVLFDKIK